MKEEMKEFSEQFNIKERIERKFEEFTMQMVEFNKYMEVLDKGISEEEMQDEISNYFESEDVVKDHKELLSKMLNDDLMWNLVQALVNQDCMKELVKGDDNVTSDR